MSEMKLNPHRHVGMSPLVMQTKSRCQAVKRICSNMSEGNQTLKKCY